MTRGCPCGGCRRLDALEAIEASTPSAWTEPELYDIDPHLDHYPEPDALDAEPEGYDRAWHPWRPDCTPGPCNHAEPERYPPRLSPAWHPAVLDRLERMLQPVLQRERAELVTEGPFF